MIEKDKENFKINILKIIDKFEVDYNLILKLYWPKITNQAAKANSTLGENQMGTRKNKSATDAALINKCTIETARINHQALVIQQNDASACYDLIFANHASLNSRREGTPKKIL